jgi:hypothetical protein
VPGPAEQAQSRKLFKEGFADELRDRSPAARRSLALKLQDMADKTTDNAADRFVLLIGARDAAAEGGDLRLAARAAGSAASLYDVDAVRLTADAALKASLKAVTPELRADDLKVGLDLESALVLADDYPTAAKVLTALQPLAAGDPAAALVVGDRVKQLARMRSAREHAEAASEQLKKDPKDPAASAAIGEFLCFSKGDFEHGLPLLARSSDASTAAAAARDLAGGPGQEIAIGDGWWDLAEKNAHDMFKAAMQRRAVSWYAKALAGGQVIGLNRIVLEKRIAVVPPPVDDADSLFRPATETASNVPEQSLMSRKLNDIEQWKIKQGDWTMSNGRIRGEGDSGIEFKTPLPSDCTLSFRMNVLSGMRPRVHFHNTGIMFGNEGYSKTLFPYGVSVDGSPFPYQNNQEVAIAIRFSGEQFQIDIDGKQAFKGTRKKSDSIRLELSGGDWWSKGTTEYWDFKFGSGSAK